MFVSWLGGVGQILIVEDNADIRASLLDMLEGTGHRVALAANGSEGIEALDDATMPELDGSGFLARLAQRADLNDFTVVVMSADPAKVNEMSHLPRVVEFLLKPINLDDLLVLVGRHCS